MIAYDFEKISRRMAKRFGKIEKGHEEEYTLVLFPMESNLLKAHRRHPAANSARLLEAINLALFTVDSHISGREHDTNDFESEENGYLKQALLMAFDPFTNEKVRIALEKDGLDLSDREALEKYYKIPVMCILRLQDSVTNWIKRNGSNGYFIFLENCMGSQIPHDNEYKYSAVLGTSD